MNTEIELSPKQIEFLNLATHRWNGKIGATQCGKTYIDVTQVIPERILEREGKNGLNVIFGVTKETIERNVLEPMRDFWGERLVSEINNRNIARLFGQKVYCLGAEKVNQVKKVRGAKFKYAYCDELVDLNEEVFNLLKSRLSLDYSVCDFTGNPSYPKHHIKKFIDSDADVYCQNWTIFDNPFLSKRVVDELIKEYSGSVYYDRYILGKWQRAEGIIYPLFADKPDRYLITDIPPLMEINAGLDFGGSRSAHSMTASGITRNYQQLIALKSKRYKAEGTTPKDVDRYAVEFVGEVLKTYGRCDYVYWDSAEQVLGRGIRDAISKAYPDHNISVRECYKTPINDRIQLALRLMGLDRFKIAKDCESLKNALCEAVWDEKSLNDMRLDDGSTDIDSIDSWEYSWTRNMNRFIF